LEEVGVRELKQRASEILRGVRESKEAVTITHRGRPVARLVPVEDAQAKQAEATAVWADMDGLAREISVHWPAAESAVKAVREQRRTL
jgi:prevent-host-death family protein